MKNKNVVTWLMAGGIAILPFLPPPNASVSDWTYFLGRFHILLLHFPVALILLLVGWELWGIFKEKTTHHPLQSTLWIAAILACFSTIVAGYFLYHTGDYQGELVRQHLWGGVILGILLLSTFSWRSQFIGMTKENTISQLPKWGKRIYPILLTAIAALVLYTSHLGGSLTHGPNFLTEYTPQFTTSSERQKPVEELLLFEDILFPVFESRCQSCHNDHKTKGDFLMTSLASIQSGGKSGKPILVAGEAEQSELYHRITLPLHDEERMPPQQKKGLSADELTLLRWWIEEGGSAEMQWGEGPPGVEGQALASRFLPSFQAQQRKQIRDEKELARQAQKLEKLGKKLGLVIKPDPIQKGYFAVAQTIPPAIVNDETLTALTPHAHLFSKLSLPGSEITDDGLFVLSQMKALQALYLPKTCLKGQGLAYLQELPQLKIINLSYSFMSDEGALQLLSLAPLEKVYLFGTSISPEVWEAIEKFRPELSLLVEEGPYF